MRCETKGCKNKAIVGGFRCAECTARRKAESAAHEASVLASHAGAPVYVHPKSTEPYRCPPGCDCDTCSFVRGAERR